MALLAVMLTVAACHPGSHVPPVTYTGHDANDIPYYTRRPFTQDERALLLRVYGVEDPSHLYISDSTEGGLLKYDTDVKTCRTCYVNSYRVGFVSMRRAGESWDSLEVRIRAMSARELGPSARAINTSTAALDPDIRADVEHMLADARKAGFHLRVEETYRSPAHEAWLMNVRPYATHTLTSLHSYGRAIDIIVGDGNRAHPKTLTEWIAFRKWVAAYRGDEFRILGPPEQSWDWPHVELPSAKIGFHSIEDALDRARKCTKSQGTPCDFMANLPPAPARPAR